MFDFRLFRTFGKMEENIIFDDIITNFLLKTTRLRPRLTLHEVLAALHCGFMANAHPEDDEEAAVIPLTTGSVAEFYIEPMLKCFGDIDMMYHENTSLAIPRGHSPPTQLPDAFHNYVDVFEIIDSHFPGYVYLELRYLLTQCNDNDTYNAAEYDRGGYLAEMFSSIDSNSGLVTVEPHGPAQQLSQKDAISVDGVTCVRCLMWPTQAADWPTRRRQYEWPDSATVDRVVSNGCDLVGVAHRQCREHEWMGTHQRRLSFSRAEIVLMNSWMPEQQIIYHLLRVFLKTTGFTESADNAGSGTLSNYYIKTLMLWACELKPPSWWTDNFSFTALCVDLLHLLSRWVNQGYYPHYFITGCNLLDPCDRENQIRAAKRLSKIDQMIFVKWFLGSYLPKCCQKCPINVTHLFDDVTACEKLQRGVSEVVDWRQSNELLDSWSAFESALLNLSAAVTSGSLSKRSYVLLMKELTKLEPNLCNYLNSLTSLYIIRKISSLGLTDRCMSLLAVLCTALGSDFNFANKKMSKLVEFLQKSAIDRLTTFRQLEVRDFGSVVTIVTTDFEAMYAYKLGDYQRCLQLSTQDVHTLLYAVGVTSVLLLPEFLQLLDDDIVSLTALTLIVNPECRLIRPTYVTISQLTLSLYLMTQCQLKLRHSMTSLTQTLDYIEVTQRTHPLEYTLDQLTLKLAYRKILTHISELWPYE